MQLAPSGAPALRRESPILPRRAFVWLAALVAVSIAVRIADPTGWLGSDDAGYYSAAEHIVTGTPITRLHHHYARLAMIAPIAASIALWGHTTWAVILPTFLASIVCVVAVVALGRALWGWWEGLLAGTIVAVLPYYRVLSTTAYPDVHVCLWTTTAMLLAVLAGRSNRTLGRLLLLAGSGFAVGLAVSCKVFAAAVVAGIAPAAWQAGAGGTPENADRIRRVGGMLAAFTLGGAIFMVAEGSFFDRFANDFFFPLHAHEQSRAGAAEMVAEGDAIRHGILPMVWVRLALLFHPAVSGWGVLGLLFWPAVLWILARDRGGRPLAMWAMATYLVVAFVPVTLAGGYQPYPVFHGRHILSGCVPFALCLARSAGMLVDSLFGTRNRFRYANTSDRCKTAVRPTRLGPLLAATVIVAGLFHSRELSGFRDRPTGRVGAAIRRLIATTPWKPDTPIFMTPSTYFRYRIHFPASLRARLRVAADPFAPTWWHNTTPDIVDRVRPLPPPARAYLIATPGQLAGDAESWDYGAALPHEALPAWREVSPCVTLARRGDRSVGPPRQGDPPILHLIGATDGDRSAIARTHPLAGQ